MMRHLSAYTLLLLAGLLAAACESRPAPEASARPAADATLRAPSAAAGTPPRAGVADTFDLVTIAGQPVPQPTPVAASPGSACSSEERVYSARYIFKPDSTYEHLSDARAGCGQALTAPDIVRKAGRYRITGDTLTVYVGDGDEEFQEFIARRWADSLVGNGREGPWRYVRRGATPVRR